MSNLFNNFFTPIRDGKTADEIKRTLIDNFLIWGAVFATFVFLNPIIAGVSDSSNFDFAADIVNIILLYLLYMFRRKVSLRFKTMFIIITVYSFFLSDLYQHGLYSTVKFIIVFIPFLGILVYSLKEAIMMYVVAITTFGVIGYLYIHGIIEPLKLDPLVNTTVKWINTGVILSLVSIVISMFVHYYNKSLLKIIDEKNEHLHLVNEQEQSLIQSVHDKNILLQEIHHRVKNNLAVVSGLLDLQSNLAPDEFSRSTLKLSTNRILSISKVHELLYQSEDISRIHLKQYIKELADIIIDSFNKTENEIHLSLDINIQYLNINLGVPVGIILNELITNSLKHGFNQPQEMYQIHISAFEENDFFEILYQDNGSGQIDSTEPSKPGLGKTLIESLMHQIDAQHHLDTEARYQMTFRFPKVLR